MCACPSFLRSCARLIGRRDCKVGKHGEAQQPPYRLGNVADVERKQLFCALLLARSVSKEQFKQSPRTIGLASNEQVTGS